MVVEVLVYDADPPWNTKFESHERRTVASYERELTQHRCTEVRLRETLAREEDLLRQKDELIQQQESLRRESDHRFLNGVQMIVSLLSLHARACADTDTGRQLTVAANRVATIQRVHRRLHYLDGVQTVAFKHYLEDLCDDFSAMLSLDERSEQTIAVEGIEVQLPTATGIPLGFIVNELVTNAVKYGQGRITVTLKRHFGKGFALSVSNDGQPLPDGFDPAVCKGLGMKIIRSFVEKISGELQFGRSGQGQGARFTVLFS